MLRLLTIANSASYLRHAQVNLLVSRILTEPTKHEMEKTSTTLNMTFQILLTLLTLACLSLIQLSRPRAHDLGRGLTI